MGDPSFSGGGNKRAQCRGQQRQCWGSHVAHTHTHTHTAHTHRTHWAVTTMVSGHVTPADTAQTNPAPHWPFYPRR